MGRFAIIRSVRVQRLVLLLCWLKGLESEVSGKLHLKVLVLYIDCTSSRRKKGSMICCGDYSLSTSRLDTRCMKERQPRKYKDIGRKRQYWSVEEKGSAERGQILKCLKSSRLGLLNLSSRTACEPRDYMPLFDVFVFHVIYQRSGLGKVHDTSGPLSHNLCSNDSPNPANMALRSTLTYENTEKLLHDVRRIFARRWTDRTDVQSWKHLQPRSL